MATHDQNIAAIGAKAPGLRARGKQERRRRLREAAREVITERGYDGATTREIAARAEVAIGTLFVYAPEKRDLLFLIMNDELDVSFDAAAASVRPHDPLIDQLLHILEPLYRYFERGPAIGRDGVREIFLFQGERKENLGPEAARVYDRINRIRAALVKALDGARAEHRIGTEMPAHVIAQALLWMHWGHIQSWLASARPSAGEGLAGLRRLLAMFIGGLGPKPGEF